MRRNILSALLHRATLVATVQERKATMDTNYQTRPQAFCHDIDSKCCTTDSYVAQHSPSFAVFSDFRVGNVGCTRYVFQDCRYSRNVERWLMFAARTVTMIMCICLGSRGMRNKCSSTS